MKEYRLKDHWRLAGFPSDSHFSPEEIEDRFSQSAKTRAGVFFLERFPAQVHEVLIDNGVIENPNYTGINKDLWIDEMDWCYLCDFDLEEPGLESFLEFRGLDTFADICLNGKRMASCDDVYLQHKLPVTGELKTHNRLIIYFHSAKKAVDRVVVPERYGGKVPGFSAVRAFRSGFHDFNGPIPTLIRCGVYDDVVLKQRETVLIDEVRIDAVLEGDSGAVEAEAALSGAYDGAPLTLTLYDENNKIAAYAEETVRSSPQKIKIELEHPRRWWPRTHGTPYCYRAVLSCGGERGDSRERTVGFRSLELAGDFDYRINGKPLKLWGANLAHPDTVSNCYRGERMDRLLDLAELGNYNILRVWGESEIYPETFYEECDRRGILIWQDFYLCYSMYSEEPAFLEQCRKEAEQLVKRLRHHPCLLLWCGGNETLLSRDYDFPGEYCFGEKIVREIYPEVCGRLDPRRHYHVSSPYGGNWANDPSAGDTHGYTHLWFVPGRKFPVFLSENSRMSVPPLRTLKRMMTREELWPSGYDGRVTRANRLEWPESWNRHTTNEGFLKLGPVEHYLDADSPEELVYRIGAAHAEYIRRDVERFRRGYSAEGPGKGRRTKGHMLWKFNNNSNIISYGIVDYFLEPYYPYYELKRCYEPVLLSVEFADRAYVWITNDSAETIRGTVRIGLFDVRKNAYVDRMEAKFQIEPDGSRPICSLDPFGQFRKKLLVCAEAVSDQGAELARCVDTPELERNMEYPEDSGLSLRLENDSLFLKCERFARCVEVSGNDDGDEFGWLFSDNYFDLLPGREKAIKILRAHKQGTISAKGHYDGRRAEVKL